MLSVSIKHPKTRFDTGQIFSNFITRFITLSGVNSQMGSAI